ncbi:MAG TPA: DUF1643 domain-containing protein [Ktedonobacterales bacterium]|jgi:hypothetical protein|nr:DUF1643 domain-containing protein [Ktedonobacterales bacterium]
MDDDGAIIVGDYRYLLWRTWGGGNHARLLWIMLNPSTADESQDDRTLDRCVSFSKRENYGGLEVVNLFAYRTPYPRKLRDVCDPIGSENTQHLKEAVQRAAACEAKVVVAWGAMSHEGIYKQQADIVLARLKQCPEIHLYCLGKTVSGCPKHPCRLASNTDMSLYA